MIVARRIALALLLLLGAVSWQAPLMSQTASPAAGRGPDISAARLKARLFALADDSMTGRDPGTLGNYRASEHIAAEFRRYGLEPAGDKGTWFQTLPFVVRRLDPKSVFAVDDRQFKPITDYVLIPPAGSLPAGAARAIEGSQVVFGGIAADTGKMITGLAAKGKFVILVPPTEPDGRRNFRIRVPGIMPRLKDAAAIGFVSLDVSPREVIEAWTVRRMVIKDGTPSRIVVPHYVVISPEVATQLLGAPFDRASVGQAGRTVKGHLGWEETEPEYPSRNVVGILRGSDPALRGQYVSLTAHNDHVGYTIHVVDHDSIRAYNRVIRPSGADTPDHPPTDQQWTQIRTILDSLRRLRPARPDSIRNGADDDGTGTVNLLEIAQALSAAPRLRRSILFVSHTAEELGLLGSAWFTEHPTVPVDSIVAEIDQDMVGRGSTEDVPDGGPGYLEIVGARRLSKEFGDILEAVNARQPQPFKFNYNYDADGHPLQYYCRADHYNYARYDIPSVALSRGEHVDYHQVTDEPQYIDYDALARVARLVYDAALTLGNLDHRPKVDFAKRDPKAICRQ